MCTSWPCTNNILNGIAEVVGAEQVLNQDQALDWKEKRTKVCVSGLWKKKVAFSQVGSEFESELCGPKHSDTRDKGES